MPSKNIYYKGVYENKPKEIIISQPTTIINLIDSNHYTLNLQSNTNLTLTNPTTSKYTFTINNTSNYQITWDTAIKWEGGFPPTTSNTNDIILIDYDGTDYYGCVLDDIRSTLLLDVYPGAAAAYSLRALSASNIDQPVVGVRRSSDDAEQDFTAAEVADGTMTAWVNTEVVKFQLDGTSGNENMTEINCTSLDGQSIGGVDDVVKLTASVDGLIQYFISGKTPDSNNTYKVSFDYYFPSSNTGANQFSLLQPNSSDPGNYIAIEDTWTTFSVETLGGSNLSAFRGRSAIAGDVYYLKNYTITQTTADGHVVTWYDQSGNGNDATQSTAANQPKIVDAGVLVDENGKPAVLLDGTNDHLVSTNAYPTMAYQSTFYVASSTGTNNRILDTRGTGAPTAVQGWHHKYSQPGPAFDITVIDNGSLTDLKTTGITRTGKNLVSVFMYGGSGSSIDEYTNGSLSDSVTSVNNIDFDSGNQLYIGANVNGANSQLFGGKIQDIILYNSNQASNRTAIELNINDHYSIYT